MDIKRLIYLHRILKRHDNHWTKKAFLELDKLAIGWSKAIKETLKIYDLPDDLTTIKAMTRKQWTKTVKEKVEVKNTQRLLNECFKSVDGNKVPKTKTKHIVESLKKDTYVRKPQDDIIGGTKHVAKTLMIARFGMLECGQNFKGSASKICRSCNAVDDEEHRMNHCVKLENLNFVNYPQKTNFTDIYSNNPVIIKNVINCIEQVWNTRTAHGSMNH